MWAGLSDALVVNRRKKKAQKRVQLSSLGHKSVISLLCVGSLTLREAHCLVIRPLKQSYSGDPCGEELRLLANSHVSKLSLFVFVF